MTAEEFFRKRLIEMTDSETMKKIHRVVNLDKQAQICEEYHQKQLELTAVSQAERTVCPDCRDKGWLYGDNNEKRSVCPCRY
jgi:predicted Zn-ribbon and HTH transcriptional regulator